MVATKKLESRLKVNNLNANYQRLSFGWILAGIITLLLIATTSLYWLPHTSKTITPISQPGASMFVSRTSPAMISLLVNPQKFVLWQSLVVLARLVTVNLNHPGLNVVVVLELEFL